MYAFLGCCEHVIINDVARVFVLVVSQDFLFILPVKKHVTSYDIVKYGPQTEYIAFCRCWESLKYFWAYVARSSTLLG